MIDHVEHPPAHGPSLPKGVGNSVCPEAAGNGYGCQIGVPGVAWILRHDAALVTRIVGGRVRCIDGLLLEDPLDGRRADVDACPGQFVGDLHLFLVWGRIA